MFEDYLQDSYEFLQIARSSTEIREARRYYRASTFCIASAIEAFVNYIADSLAKADQLPQHELAFLNDKVLIFSGEKGELLRKDEFHRLDEKLRCILKRFSPGYNFNNQNWSDFKELKKFRDSLVHPRQADDEVPISDYNRILTRGIRAIIELMNIVLRDMFGQPLRKQLLDLIPE